jgi:hypothetical protein
MSWNLGLDDELGEASIDLYVDRARDAELLCRQPLGSAGIHLLRRQSSGSGLFCIPYAGDRNWAFRQGWIRRRSRMDEERRKRGKSYAYDQRRQTPYVS